MRGRSRTPASIEFEIAGHVLLYLLIRWLIVEASRTHGVADPLRISFTGVYRELLAMMPNLITSTPHHITKILLPRLLSRVASHRVPLRPGRHYPRHKFAKGPDKNVNTKKTPKKKSTGQVSNASQAPAPAESPLPNGDQG